QREVARASGVSVASVETGRTAPSMPDGTAPGPIQASVDEAVADAMQAVARIAPEGAPLPQAPWSRGELSAAEVPSVLLAAWRSADNAAECAPLAPVEVGRAVARRAPLEGGWAVEFDQRGARGMGRDGTPCERCGRAAFGVAGTAMSPDADAMLDGAQASWADGSFALIESGEGAAVASIAIQGQNCVYQVWSMLGEEHLRSLVERLRFVRTR
ncbi:MAG: hypothetical protein NZ898_16110, partial [Myxococcota bacterium]|nr:hypothetical protein [Myxococcota bacterium]